MVDAYNGTVDFYVSDPADPLLRAYERIFPGLFKPLDVMSPELRKHIRYPEDLFLIQAQLYRAYHMDAPEVFYNREDLWQFPQELVGMDGGSTASTMPPYYTIMRPATTRLRLCTPAVSFSWTHSAKRMRGTSSAISCSPGTGLRPSATSMP